jgi:uncharacterized RDD family membrane protein YckC
VHTSPPDDIATPAFRRETAAAPGEHVETRTAAVAPLWRRAIAWLVDGAAIGGVGTLYLWAASAVAGVGRSVPQLTGIDKWMARAHSLQPVLLPGVILVAVIALAYSAAFAVFLDGRTFGRLLAGIRLVDKTGLPPTPTRAVVRALLSAVSFGLFLGGFWVAIFDRRGQTLHDKLTSTFVVRPI